MTTKPNGISQSAGENVAADQLQSFVRRIESLDDELQALNADKSEVYKEAKSAGFDVKVMRKLIADRRKDASERSEFEAIYDLYAEALGMYRSTGERLVRARVETKQQFPVEHDADGVFPDDELPPASRGYVGEDDLREPAATVRGQITQEGDAPLKAAAQADGEGMSGHAEYLSAVSSEPDATPAGSVVDNTSGVTGGESAAPKFDARSLRPHCKQPYACGGQGKKHCWKCMKAAGLEDAA